MEKNLDNEESLVDFFLSTPMQDNQNSHGTSNKIITLQLPSGKQISVKHSTLCLEKNSLLAKQFNDEEWITSHKSKAKNENNIIIINELDYFFMEMINRLRLRAILKSGHKLSDVCFKNIDNKEGFLKYVSKIFPENQKTILGDGSSFDSLIVTSFQESNTILSWLPPNHTRLKPVLIYRASRDGWKTSTFHSKCDNKGSSITVIKTDKGNVFGGYIDKDWTSKDTSVDFYIESQSAFIFSLKCNANLSPTKLNIKRKCYEKAAIGHHNYGPTFGDGDIDIFSESTLNETHESEVGTTYEMPNGISDPYFLNGKKKFRVAEIEVFQL